MPKIYLFLCFLLLPLAFDRSEANEKVGVYELKKGDFSAKLTNYGATVLSVILPDKNGSRNCDFELNILQF